MKTSVSPALLGRLRAMADPDGFVPFDRFMEEALYGQGVGFYARDRTPFGPSGDFYTAVHVHPLFGRTIAERIKAVLSALGPVRPFRIVEVGAGDGTLARDVLTGLASDAPQTGSIEYCLIDRSSVLRQAALEKVREASDRAGIPVRVATSLGSDGPFRGVVLANEFLDAQPVRRLRWDSGAWVELGAQLADDRVIAAERPQTVPLPSPPPDPPEPGGVVEISPMAEGFVREVADHLTQGLVILTDYGMDDAELRAAHPTGTLTALRSHRWSGDPFEAAGNADLSTFVNFTRVREAARRAGLVEVAFRSQAEALGAWGLPRLLERAVQEAASSEEAVRVRLAVKNLLFGFERFHALELAPPGLSGATLAALR